MGIYSPYAIAQSELPKWKPGEDLAAAGFVGMTIFIVLDVNIGIWRVFRKRQGLYYWAMTLGTIACLVDAIGVILKFLTPGLKHVWGVYTALLLCGWSVYAPAQLLVLYSRLHLVNDQRKMQRLVLISILSTILFFIIPTWIVFVPACDPDPKISSLWSPRDAIVERYTQIGFTVVEVFLSGVYIWSLLGLLNLKASVRQRRVMLDLIYVNVIVVSLDLVVVVLVYLNQTGISHPLQTFSYALKLKLEFVVLNQLMAVAARGLQRDNFEERRYHHSSVADGFSAECRQWDQKIPDEQAKGWPLNRQKEHDSDHPAGSLQITLPSPTVSKQGRSPRDKAWEESVISSYQDRYIAPSSKSQDVPINSEKTGGNAFTTEQEMQVEDYMGAGSATERNEADSIRHEPSEAFSGETLHVPESARRVASPHLHPRQLSDLGDQARQSIHDPFAARGQSHDQPQTRQRKKMPYIATLKRRVPKNGRHCAYKEGEEQEEIGVHMWENRKGSLVMEVPWFHPRDGS